MTQHVWFAPQLVQTCFSIWAGACSFLSLDFPIKLRELKFANNYIIGMASQSTSTSGYNYTFQSEEDDSLKCLICLGIARDPWQHGECGRLFCQNCLDKHGKSEPCPNCRIKQPSYLKDTKSKSITLV